MLESPTAVEAGFRGLLEVAPDPIVIVDEPIETHYLGTTFEFTLAERGAA